MGHPCDPRVAYIPAPVCTGERRAFMIRAAAPILVAIMLMSACGGTPPPTEPYPDRRVLHVADSIGGGSAADSIAFGYLVDACLGPSGEVLALDQAEACVRVYSPAGEPRGRIGRRGEGPGEMGSPMYLEVLEGRILVQDGTKDGYLVFDGSYALEDEVQLWPSNAPMDMQACGSESSFVAYRLDVRPEGDRLMMPRSFGLYRLGEKEHELVYRVDEVEMDPTDFTSLLTSIFWAFSFAADDSGRVYIAPVSTTDYRVTAWSPAGESLFTVTADIPRVRRTDEEMRAEKAFVEGYIRSVGVQGVEVDWDPDPYRSLVVGLGTDGMGRLWVQRGTGTEPVFDVYDPNRGGAHLFSARLPLPGRRWQVRMYHDTMLAWDEDPPSGVQTLYLIELPGEGG